jgi:hypothetical protein
MMRLLSVTIASAIMVALAMAFVLNEREALAGNGFIVVASPATATNVVGTDHTVTMTVTFNGQPANGADVFFDVTAGPNTGEGASGTTDANGEFSFTYTGAGGVGQDTIEACTFGIPLRTVERPALGIPVACDTVTKDWIQPTPSPSPSPSPGATLAAGTATPSPSPSPTAAAPVQLPGTGGTSDEGSTRPVAAIALLSLLISIGAVGTTVLRRAR